MYLYDLHYLTCTGALSTSAATDVAYLQMPVSGGRYVFATALYWSTASTGLGNIDIPFNVFTAPAGGGTQLYSSNHLVNIQTTSGIYFFTGMSVAVATVGSGVFLRQTAAAAFTGNIGAKIGLHQVV